MWPERKTVSRPEGATVATLASEVIHSEAVVTSSDVPSVICARAVIWYVVCDAGELVTTIARTLAGVVGVVGLAGAPLPFVPHATSIAAAMAAAVVFKHTCVIEASPSLVCRRFCSQPNRCSDEEQAGYHGREPER